MLLTWNSPDVSNKESNSYKQNEKIQKLNCVIKWNATGKKY